MAISKILTVEFHEVTSDPSSGGLAAPIGSQAYDTTNGDAYTKTGGANTDWSKFGTGGGGTPTVTSIDNTDSPYAASSGEVIICDTSSGAIEVDLPTASGISGETITIRKDGAGDTTTNLVTLDPNGSETIDGFSTIDLFARDGFANITLMSDGTNWIRTEHSDIGIYVPTYTGNTNIDSVTGVGARFTRTLDHVVVSGDVSPNATVDATFTRFRVSLPFASSVSAATDLAGTFSQRSPSTGGVAEANPINNDAFMAYTCNGTNAEQSKFIFQYIIL